MQGHPGSGKSTLAHSLARALRWPLVDKDDIRDALEPLTPQVPAAQLNVISYEAMWAVTERQLALGSSVVVDSPLARPELYDRACALALQVLNWNLHHARPFPFLPLAPVISNILQ